MGKAGRPAYAGPSYEDIVSVNVDCNVTDDPLEIRTISYWIVGQLNMCNAENIKVSANPHDYT
jgi:hypothetical protein